MSESKKYYIPALNEFKAKLNSIKSLEPNIERFVEIAFEAGYSSALNSISTLFEADN